SGAASLSSPSAYSRLPRRSPRHERFGRGYRSARGARQLSADARASASAARCRVARVVALLPCPGPERDAVTVRLHALLLRAARFEVARHRPTLPHPHSDELQDIATETADYALRSVLRRLDDFCSAAASRPGPRS